MGQGRVELPTSRLSGVRSNHLSYWPNRPADLLGPWKLGCTPDVGLTFRIAPKRFLRKEVIQPQVPLRLPCYDFTPVADRAVVGCPLAVGAPASGKANSHGVTGGVYKARERIHRGVLIRDY